MWAAKLAYPNPYFQKKKKSLISIYNSCIVAHVVYNIYLAFTWLLRMVSYEDKPNTKICSLFSSWWFIDSLCYYHFSGYSNYGFFISGLLHLFLLSFYDFSTIFFHLCDFIQKFINRKLQRGLLGSCLFKKSKMVFFFAFMKSKLFVLIISNSLGV